MKVSCRMDEFFLLTPNIVLDCTSEGPCRALKSPCRDTFSLSTG